MSDPKDLVTELQQAIEASRQAAATVAVLRHALITRDLPREWYFSHAGFSGWVRDQPARTAFSTVTSTRAEVEAKLREAILALTFDTSDGPRDVQASASCKDTLETVELSVHVPQVEPACVRAEGHEWSLVWNDPNPRDQPGGLRLTDACPHCDGRKISSFARPGDPSPVVSFDAPHHYPEGWVRRSLEDATRARST